MLNFKQKVSIDAEDSQPGMPMILICLALTGIFSCELSANIVQ